MDRIAGEVRRELERFGPAAGMAGLVKAWPASVGKEIAVNAWPARLARDGTLHVTVSSSAWAFELTHFEAEILARLTAALGESAPSRLRFAPGLLPEPGAESVKTERKSPLHVSAEERAEGARIAADIEDEALRRLVAKAAAASLARAADDRSVW